MFPIMLVLCASWVLFNCLSPNIFEKGHLFNFSIRASDLFNFFDLFNCSSTAITHNTRLKTSTKALVATNTRTKDTWFQE